MLKIARYFLILMGAVFIVLGLSALISPQRLAAQLALLPQLPKGLAELRGLYGGLFVSWGVILLLSMRATLSSQGLLLAMAITMGAITVARIVSLTVDHEAAFNVPAGIAEGLIALASWTLYRAKRTSVV